MRVWIDKVASATRNVPIRRDVRLTDRITAREGYVVVGRIHGEKTVYNQLEDEHGRLVTLQEGDVIAGVLGQRNALHGYSGYVPESVSPGDRLHLLNIGGVVGVCSSHNPEVGRPFELEVLGGLLVFPGFEDRSGVPAHIGMNAIRAEPKQTIEVPLVYVAGTCMNSGKTTAAIRLIRQLSKRGVAVGACKLTGVSLRRDVLQMMDYGARWAFSFTDAGIVSTTAKTAGPVAGTLLAHLVQSGAQAIVAELGDGILGEYGVAEILAESSLRSSTTVMVLCANDPVGTWGAQQVLRERFGYEIDAVSGPTTDNLVGTRFIEKQLGLVAINARTQGAELGDHVVRCIAERANWTLPV